MLLPKYHLNQKMTYLYDRKLIIKHTPRNGQLDPEFP